MPCSRKPALDPRSTPRERATAHCTRDRFRFRGAHASCVPALLALLLAVASACTSPRPPGAGDPGRTAQAAASSPARTTTASARPACLAALDLATPVRPPFYRVQGHGGAELFLLGTIHVGPPTGWKLSPALASAISRADEVAMEIDLRNTNEERVSDLIAALALLDGQRRLVDVLAPQTVALLEREETRLGEFGFPAGRRKHMKPWFVAVGIAEAVTARCGLPPDGALEFTLLGTLRDRPLRGLESIEDQLHFVDDLALPLQDLWLRESLARLDEAELDLIELIAAWRNGDEAKLVEIAQQGVAELPELEAVYDVLLGQRNRRWLATLRPLLDDGAHHGARTLVAVGALHLVGEDGLVTLLRKAGYTVDAIDHDAPARTP